MSASQNRALHTACVYLLFGQQKDYDRETALAPQSPPSLEGEIARWDYDEILSWIDLSHIPPLPSDTRVTWDKLLKLLRPRSVFFQKLGHQHLPQSYAETT